MSVCRIQTIRAVVFEPCSMSMGNDGHKYNNMLVSDSKRFKPTKYKPAVILFIHQSVCNYHKDYLACTEGFCFIPTNKHVSQSGWELGYMLAAGHVQRVMIGKQQYFADVSKEGFAV